MRAQFFLVDVRRADLQLLAEMIASGDVRVEVGSTLPLHDAVRAHRMLGGQAPRPGGKIVLTLP